MNLPPTPFGREVIMELIPHRPPFLLVDEILELVPGKRVVGQARDPRRRLVVPGPLSRAAGDAGRADDRGDRAGGRGRSARRRGECGQDPLLRGIDGCRFKRIVEPGDLLVLECEFVRVRGPIAKGEGRALVGDELAAEASLTVFVGPR